MGSNIGLNNAQLTKILRLLRFIGNFQHLAVKTTTLNYKVLNIICQLKRNRKLQLEFILFKFLKRNLKVITKLLENSATKNSIWGIQFNLNRTENRDIINEFGKVFNKLDGLRIEKLGFGGITTKNRMSRGFIFEVNSDDILDILSCIKPKILQIHKLLLSSEKIFQIINGISNLEELTINQIRGIVSKEVLRNLFTLQHTKSLSIGFNASEYFSNIEETVMLDKITLFPAPNLQNLEINNYTFQSLDLEHLKNCIFRSSSIRNISLSNVVFNTPKFNDFVANLSKLTYLKGLHFEDIAVLAVQQSKEPPKIQRRGKGMKGKKPRRMPTQEKTTNDWLNILPEAIQGLKNLNNFSLNRIEFEEPIQFLHIVRALTMCRRLEYLELLELDQKILMTTEIIKEFMHLDLTLTNLKISAPEHTCERHKGGIRSHIRRIGMERLSNINYKSKFGDLIISNINLPKIKNIELSHFLCSNQAFESFGHKLKAENQFTKIKLLLREEKFTSGFNKFVEGGIRPDSHLKSLNLMGTTLHTQELFVNLWKTDQLRSLTISMYNEDMIWLIRYLVHTKQLRKLEIVIENKGVYELDMIFEALEKNLTLQKLHIKNPQLSYTDLKAFQQGIERNPTLRHVALESDNWNQPTKLRPLIEEIIRKTKNLISLDMNFAIFVRGMRRDTKLELEKLNPRIELKHWKDII